MPPESTAKPDRNLALELVRVTEAAALAAARWVGRGDKIAADGAAVDAMRFVLDSVSMDGVVVARSAFESSIHYRSAVLFGTCTQLDGADKLRALDLVTEALIPGRVAELRRPTDRELAATLMLALPIERWSLKVSAGWPDDPPEDVAGPAWAGVVPLGTGYGAPRPAPDLRPGIPVPPSVRAL